VPNKTKNPVITLTTDFGLQDHYVACMKGVILQIAPDARILDVTHEIEPHNILGGAFVLGQLLDWFPPDTIHIVVVDPGVGTSRRVIAARYDGQTIIAPDNGIVSFAHQTHQVEAACTVTNPRVRLSTVSNTFHGRDVMAPAAAHLAMGLALVDLGQLTDHLEILAVARPKPVGVRALEGEIVHIDRFGNLLSNIGRQDVAGVSTGGRQVAVAVDGVDLGPLQQTYADATAGDALALMGGSGFLEIAVRLGSAREKLSAAVGAKVIVREN